MENVAIMASPLGYLRLKATEEGLTAIDFLDEETIITTTIPESLREPIRQLKAYFAKQQSEFNLRLAPQGTDFQLRVWHELQKIPYGKTLSYRDIAHRLGNPKVIRAAASANGKNPIPIIIPCHRVIGSDGSLVGFSGGMHRKKWLLDHESPSIQQRLF